MAIGLLSIPTPTRLKGMESFKGRSFHRFYWPHQPVEMAGKKVAVIGTGATAIQVIVQIADKVGELNVFQRRPNWAAPPNNGAISDAEMADIRSRYDEIFATCARPPGGSSTSRTGVVSMRSPARSGWRCGTGFTMPRGSRSGCTTSERYSLTRKRTLSSRSTSPTRFADA
jgi:cation diffusion facilitator CzcD-associated flavoprotein CzcO